MLRRNVSLLFLAILFTGCGGAPGPMDGGTELADATVADPQRALGLAPLDHLNSLSADPTAIIPVSALEADYETVFGSLSQTLGVTETTPQVVADIHFIASQPETGFFDLAKKPILNNPLGVTGVSFQPVNYDTTVSLPGGNQTFHVSGGLLMPVGISKAQVKGIVVYFHGTTFNNAQVGSTFAGSGETQLVAQVFASAGYIVIIPDYVGQGVDFVHVHPYVLYPKVSAQTAADMLAAVKPKLTTQYGFSGTDTLKLFSMGYSEGGSYALWFNQYLSSTPAAVDPFYRLTHSVGLEGAYSASEVTFGFLFDDVRSDQGNTYNIQSQSLTNSVKAILSADAFLSYAAYSGGGDFSAVFQPDFFAMKATPGVAQNDCNVNGTQLSIADAFALPGATIASQLLSCALGKSANGARFPDRLNVSYSTQNSVKALVSTALFTPGPLAQLKAALSAADADLSAVADAGVSIVTLDQDSVVVPNNFDALLAKFPSKIKNALKIDHTQLQVLSALSPSLRKAVFVPVDHMHGLVYEYLYALHIFNGF